jgi:histidinol-phosphatase (PHP family)
MEDVISDAIQMGMNEICFTDHVDYGIKRDYDDPRGIEYRSGGPGEPERMEMINVDYCLFEATIRELRYCYVDRISIKMGLEFGMQTHTIPQYEALFTKYPFDFIILSVHQIEDKEFWTQEFQRGRTQQEYNERYYEEILALVKQYHNYSVLGHMDLINRYDKAGYYPFERIRPLITEILKTVIADGKGIEVNTSSYRYGLPDLTPSRDILRLYRELGGTIITIGSDSHKKEHLGFRIQEVKQELRKLGFSQFCTFSKMRPIYHEL